MDWAVFKEGVASLTILIVLLLGEDLDWDDMETNIKRLQEEVASASERLAGADIYFRVCLYGPIFLAEDDISDYLDL